MGLLVSTQSYLFLVASLIFIKPYEMINRRLVRTAMRRKIQNLKNNGLVVIGITGSYGKTTTKDFLYALLKTKYRVLKTPESYNTLFGIYKVIDYELDENYDVFICEMGAYKIGEIAELCDAVLPDHGILTGINEQHLERFGSIQITVKAKFELIQSLGTHALIVLSSDNSLIVDNSAKYCENPIFYGTNSEKFSVADFAINDGTMKVTLIVDGIKLALADLKIVGFGNISNFLGAATLAYKMGISLEIIKTVAINQQPAKHRLEVRTLVSGITLIDDAYSSNVTGFKNALEVLGAYKSRPKVLVTPGIVELGNETASIHRELGKGANDTCDYVFLVGDSLRTRELKTSIANEKVVMLSTINELWDALAKLNLQNPVVLLENDLPDNY